MALAKSSNLPVLFVAVETPVEPAEPIKTADEPAAVAMKKAPVKVAQPIGEEVEMTAAPAPAPAALPSTGSSAPLIGLVGLIALSGAFIMHPATRV